MGAKRPKSLWISIFIYLLYRFSAPTFFYLIYLYRCPPLQHSSPKYIYIYRHPPLQHSFTLTRWKLGFQKSSLCTQVSHSWWLEFKSKVKVEFKWSFEVEFILTSCIIHFCFLGFNIYKQSRYYRWTLNHPFNIYEQSL